MPKHTCLHCHRDFDDVVTKDEYTQYPRGSKYADVIVDDVPWLCHNCDVNAALVLTTAMQR